MTQLDVKRLKENALTSIQLGIEDFQRSQLDQKIGGNPARALSAVRNLFAGVLLLFKYKIACSVKNPEDAYTLIFNPPEIQPVSDGDMGVEWKPQGKFKKTTIDVNTIKKRFEGFEIEVDWVAIEKLQECRNHLEHLHPENTLGEVADFVAELFPVLSDFAHQQLCEKPVNIFGSAWPVMLQHHRLITEATRKCDSAWTEADVPEKMQLWVTQCKCESCGSSLLLPDQNDIDNELSVKDDDTIFQYVCYACGVSGLIAPLLIKKLNDAFYDDPRDGGEPSIEDCLECGRSTFHIEDQCCLWCDAELEYNECEDCGDKLRQEHQFNGGRCDYHTHLYEKMMHED